MDLNYKNHIRTINRSHVWSAIYGALDPIMTITAPIMMSLCSFWWKHLIDHTHRLAVYSALNKNCFNIVYITEENIGKYVVTVQICQDELICKDWKHVSPVKSDEKLFFQSTEIRCESLCISYSFRQNSYWILLIFYIRN